MLVALPGLWPSKRTGAHQHRKKDCVGYGCLTRHREAHPAKTTQTGVPETRLCRWGGSVRHPQFDSFKQRAEEGSATRRCVGVTGSHISKVYFRRETGYSLLPEIGVGVQFPYA